MKRTMPKKSGSHRVVLNTDGGWDVKKDGAGRSSGHFDNKQDAVNAGRKISQNQGTEFYIHGKDGKIHRKGSHGNDPVSYTHLRAHETDSYLVCRLLLEK